MTTATQPPADARTRQRAAVERWLRLFLVPGTASELRALETGGRKAASEVFVDPALMAERAVEWGRDAKGVYFTPNPVNVRLAGARVAARKADIDARHWLLIDADPVRDAGTNSTDEEREAAWRVLDRAMGLLEVGGLTSPIVGDSGNGWHASYPIDLPANDETQALVKAVLQGLAKRCDDDGARIDTTCHDAPRIWKCYGTMARKGPASDVRPWRWARVIETLDPKPWASDTATVNSAALWGLPERWKLADDMRRGRPAGEPLTPAERARKYVAAMAPAVSGQGGHKQTFDVAQAIVRGFGLSDADAWPILCEYNARCQPPWSESELRHKLADALNKSKLPAGYLLAGGERPTAPTAATAGPVELAARPLPFPVPVPAALVGVAQPEPWGRPIPLNRAPDPSPFPLDVLPGPVRRWVEEAAWACNSPPDFAAVPALVVAGMAVGNSRKLQITRSHLQGPALFAAVIGRPGSGKSPPFELAKHPLEEAERKWRREWELAVELWEGSDAGSRGDRPKLRRCLLDETTVEAAVRLLGDNPRGLLMARDELAAVVTGLNQYKDGGKGSDRQTLLKIWGGSTVLVDRAKLDGVPIVVYRPCMGIVGTIQPSVIEWLRGEPRGDKPPPDDGFLDRFLLSYPADLPAIGEQWREVTEAAADDWRQILDGLLDLKQVPGPSGDPTAQLIPLDSSGREAWAAFTHEHAEEINGETFPDWLRGPWAKLVPGYLGRMSLIVHLLRWACGDADGDAVDGGSVGAAWKLVGYFKDHARRVYHAMGADPRLADAHRVLAWICRRGTTETFSRSDAYEGLRRSFRRPEDLHNPLELLVGHRYLRHLETATPKGPGRRPTPRYEVNPAALEVGQ